MHRKITYRRERQSDKCDIFFCYIISTNTVYTYICLNNIYVIMNVSIFILKYYIQCYVIGNGFFSFSVCHFFNLIIVTLFNAEISVIK